MIVRGADDGTCDSRQHPRTDTDPRGQAPCASVTPFAKESSPYVGGHHIAYRSSVRGPIVADCQTRGSTDGPVDRPTMVAAFAWIRASPARRRGRPQGTSSRRPARDCSFLTEAVVPTPTGDEPGTCASDDKRELRSASPRAGRFRAKRERRHRDGRRPQRAGDLDSLDHAVPRPLQWCARRRLTTVGGCRVMTAIYRCAPKFGHTTRRGCSEGRPGPASCDRHSGRSRCAPITSAAPPYQAWPQSRCSISRSASLT
jgi:hypothetical protein